MLIVSLFILLTAVALPIIQATPALIIRTTSLIFLTALAMVANSYSWFGVGAGFTLYNGLTIVSAVALTAQALFLAVGAIALVPWAPIGAPGYTSFPRIGTYPIFVMMTTIGGCILVSSGDAITFYLSLELQSFSVYVLASIYRDSESATHSGLLYFLLGGLSSCFILLGFSLIYGETGMTSIDSIMTFINVSTNTLYDSSSISWGIFLGFISISTGLLFKITAAPFHNWGPDVYNGVPTIVTTWLAVIPKISLVLFILILSTDLNGCLEIMANSVISYDIWSTLLLLSSVLSLAVGTIVGLVQKDIKRLLAYSTVSHIGFILLAISVSTLEGSSATILYLLQYTLTAILSFSAVLGLGYYHFSSEKNIYSLDLIQIKDLTNAIVMSPGVTVCLATALFSMAGVPPLLGFFGKQAVLYAAMNSGLYFVSIVAVITSVISASYYLYMVRVSHFSMVTPNGIEVSLVQGQSKSFQSSPITSVHSYTLSILTLFLVFFMASPDLILDCCRLVTLNQFGS